MPFNIGTIITGGVVSIGGTVAWALGGFDPLLKFLLLMMCVDILTGLAKSLYTKNSDKSVSGRFRSSAFCKGLIIKGCCMGVIAVSMVLGELSGIEPLRDWVVTGFIVLEATSILENAAMLGAPIPQSILDVLEEVPKMNKPDKK